MFYRIDEIKNDGTVKSTFYSEAYDLAGIMGLTPQARAKTDYSSQVRWLESHKHSAMMNTTSIQLCYGDTVLAEIQF